MPDPPHYISCFLVGGYAYAEPPSLHVMFFGGGGDRHMPDPLDCISCFL
jgi:hypothetical protein